MHRFEGHFMGKKSVMDKPLLSPADGPGVDALQSALQGPEPDDLGNIFQEVLRVALQAQVDTQDSKKQVRGRTRVLSMCLC